MLFKEFGSKNLPAIILLHGGGLSWWSLKGIIESLQSKYHIVAPIIDGHGEDGYETFVSIEKSAEKLISYIDNKCGGSVFAIGGLSVGAQIVTEVLSVRREIAEYAIIESALVYPIRGITAMTVPLYNLFYGMIRQRWFSKMQAKTLCVPESMFEKYYKDSLKITKQSLINITLSNENYVLKSTITDTRARVLVIAGEKEIGIMRKSAQRLHEVIDGSELYIAPSMRHGEISLNHPLKYVELISVFLEKYGTKGFKRGV